MILLGLLLLFLAIFISSIFYWLSIRKRNIKLAKKIDLIIIITSMVILIGLFLAPVRRVETFYESDGWYYEETGKVWHYELMDIGMSLYTIGLIFLMMLLIIYTSLFIKYKKYIEIGKNISSLILIFTLILIIFTIVSFNFGVHYNTINQGFIFNMYQQTSLFIIIILLILLYRDLVIYAYGKFKLKKEKISIFQEELPV